MGSQIEQEIKTCGKTLLEKNSKPVDRPRPYGLFINNNYNNNNYLFQEYVHSIKIGENTFEILDYIFPGSHPRVQWTVGLV